MPWGMLIAPKPFLVCLAHCAVSRFDRSPYSILLHIALFEWLWARSLSPYIASRWRQVLEPPLSLCMNAHRELRYGCRWRTGCDHAMKGFLGQCGPRPDNNLSRLGVFFRNIPSQNVNPSTFLQFPGTPTLGIKICLNASLYKALIAWKYNYIKHL